MARVQTGKKQGGEGADLKQQGRVEGRIDRLVGHRPERSWVRSVHGQMEEERRLPVYGKVLGGDELEGQEHEGGGHQTYRRKDFFEVAEKGSVDVVRAFIEPNRT